MTVYRAKIASSAKLEHRTKADIMTTKPKHHSLGWNVLMGLLIVLACSITGRGQGAVQFNNYIPGLVDARFTGADGCGVGEGYVAELALVFEGSVIRLTPTTTFRTTSIATQGYLVPVVVTIPFVSPGSLVTLRVIIRANNGFEMFTEPITVLAGGGIFLPAPLVGLRAPVLLAQAGAVISDGGKIIHEGERATLNAGFVVPASLRMFRSFPATYQWYFKDQVIKDATNDVLIVERAAQSNAGTYTVAVTSECGIVYRASANLVVVVVPLAVDFNTDGKADLVLQHTKGSLAAWFLDNGILKSPVFLDPDKVQDQSWSVVAAADFNSDKKTDLLLQKTDGSLAVWRMDGAKRVDQVPVDPSRTTDANWRIAAVADFNGDLKPDLAWQHAEGAIGVWLMKETTVMEARMFTPSSPGDRNWRLMGAGDFNYDSKADLVWQHTNGTIAIWFMDGTRMTSVDLFSPKTPGDTSWRLAGTGDYNDDNKTDLVWQHSDGSIAVWFLDGLYLQSARFVDPRHPGDGWRVVVP
jgi:hypothetical protein